MYLSQVDIVVSGEGKFDEQTLNGKLLKEIMEVCKTSKKPLGIGCGIIDLPEEKISQLPIFGIENIKNLHISITESMNNA